MLYKDTCFRIFGMSVKLLLLRHRSPQELCDDVSLLSISVHWGRQCLCVCMCNWAALMVVIILLLLHHKLCLQVHEWLSALSVLISSEAACCRGIQCNVKAKYEYVPTCSHGQLLVSLKDFHCFCKWTQFLCVLVAVMAVVFSANCKCFYLVSRLAKSYESVSTGVDIQG